jgi:hypothetical protein
LNFLKRVTHNLTYNSIKLYSVVLFIKIIFISSYSSDGVYSKSFRSLS